GGPGDDAAPSDAAPVDAAPRDARAEDDASMPLAATPFVYVGQTDGELVVYSIDPTSGELTRRSSTRTGNFPAFAEVTPDGLRMVVVNEGSDEVAGLTIAPGTGATTLVGTRASRGGSPTHVTIDGEGRYAFAANYGGGSVAMLPILEDGGLAAASDDEAAGANAHAVVVDRTGRWLLVPAKGDDAVVVFAIDADAGAITRHGRHDTARDAGPRHLALDAAGTHAYLVNELDSTVDVLTFDPVAGALAHVQTLSTLPAAFSGSNTTAEILISPDGRFVYASNRGHDSIAVFEVQADGRLLARGRALLEARTPRSMAIDPSGTFLIAGALESNVLVRFRIGADGALTRLGTTPTDSRPFYVGIFAIPDA
ncbi:MAG: lactonase family protein, partial [Myxococcota bacterium]|nr:lactonase family protein [Myxococcota bacterium]